VTANPVAELLAGYRPQSDTETDDLRRAEELLAADDPWDRGSSLHFTASALVVHPLTRRVLLRWHDRLHAWLQVGGHGDPGEADPLAVALREGAEETGLTDLAPWPDGSLVHLVVVPVPESRSEPAHHHLDLRFLFATKTPDAARPERESAPLRWLALPEARSMTTRANLREILNRADRLLDARSGSTPPAPAP
jgi:8-oxo-dGTP pyrophosphatase MutT (NUDIX family)